MNESRKRNLTIGVVLGAILAFVLVLAKRTPPEKRRQTFARASRDGLRLARMRYGAVAAPLFSLAEHLIDRFDVAVAPDSAPPAKKLA